MQKLCFLTTAHLPPPCDPWTNGKALLLPRFILGIHAQRQFGAQTNKRPITLQHIEELFRAFIAVRRSPMSCANQQGAAGRQRLCDAHARRGERRTVGLRWSSAAANGERAATRKGAVGWSSGRMPTTTRSSTGTSRTFWLFLAAYNRTGRLCCRRPVVGSSWGIRRRAGEVVTSRAAVRAWAS